MLKTRYVVELKSKLIRKYLLDKKGEYTEVNVFGEGRKNGNEIVILEESKARLSRTDVDEFLKKKLNRLSFNIEVFPIMVTYMISHPDVENYAKKKGITVFYSYDFEI